MISKKNKALVAGVLAAGMAATSVIPALASAATTTEAAKSNSSYASMFESLYDDVITNGQANGYLSAQNNGGDSFGIPYHAVETLVVEAPDYGHETTSEAMSYIVWMAAMHDVLAKKGVISGSTGDLAKAWTTMEAMIPGCSEASGKKTSVKYGTLWKQDRLKSDPAAEGDEPSAYPVPGYGGDAVNPLYNAYKTAYGSENGYYMMNWLADVDDWYGFNGDGKFCFINTFQRGTQESCFETVPQPCLEELKWGMSGNNGIKAIFNGEGAVPKQYAFTNAPDAEDRAIQAVYFANMWNAGDPTVSALAGKMGDQCRNDMFDKYYKPIAASTRGTTAQKTGQLGDLGGQHYLMSWYTAWGGALGGSDESQYNWAWQIGCSHSHQFYQNPLAAFALIQDSAINAGMKADNAQATSDYKESFKRQIEMYLWLQSKDGPIAGGCTNSYNGRYEEYPSDLPTFYNMVYVAHPVYSDPGSNHWIGNQVWSIQRLCELYYYLKTGKVTDVTDQTYGGLSLVDALEAILSRWIGWFEENTHFDWTAPDGTSYDYCIPSSLNWGANDHDSTDPTCVPDSWKGIYNPDGNQKLSPTITGYGQGDVGCVSSLCNTLIYYAAANGVDASAAASDSDTSVAGKGLRLANKLLSAQYNTGRDDIGIAFEDHNGSLTRIFKQEVYIPSYYKGTMPDGSVLAPGATFSSIRKSYEKDPMYQDCKAVYDATGKTDTYTYKLHRFWHAGDAIEAYGAMALLYPDVKPLADEDEDGIWGDANHDGDVSVADPTLIMQNKAVPSDFVIDDYGKKWGDVDNNGDGITAADALRIQQALADPTINLDPTV